MFMEVKFNDLRYNMWPSSSIHVYTGLHARSRVDDHDGSEIQPKLSHGVEGHTINKIPRANSVGTAS